MSKVLPEDRSREDEIAQVMMGKPHVVILGAGTSRAACPTGDANGKQLPLMNDLVDLLGLERTLEKAGIDHHGRNFEDIYDQLYADDKYSKVRQELEDAVYGYFSSLQLPEHPTLYDHIVLSLRQKDVIATFNWDPFLMQAYRRNLAMFEGRLPRLQFLHGNVTVGYCESDKVLGLNGNDCKKCGTPFVPSKLLYPISAKNYQLDFLISTEWTELQAALASAFMITVFGYSAPKSDVSAIKLMKDAWGDVYARNMEQTEIIDIRSEDDLCSTWEPFIHTHHYEVHENFYDSWIANHPRRTGEAYWNQYWEANFIENNPIPKEADFPELWAWFARLREVEERESQPNAGSGS
ncbi:MAG: hypothetical protein QOE96_477 [Blastocatellia bacterium]|jgi:hypothetical protein|nr:hypothetical protein [Blastocatellia bacterium]